MDHTVRHNREGDALFSRKTHFYGIISILLSGLSLLLFLWRTNPWLVFFGSFFAGVILLLAILIILQFRPNIFIHLVKVGLGRVSKSVGRGNINYIKDVLSSLEHVMPEPKCEKHRHRIEQSFKSFAKFVENNSDCAWLLPPASNEILEIEDHKRNQMQSQFLEWSWLVAGNETGLRGILEDTKYLFITWDLSDPKKWDEMILNNLEKMLEKIGIKTKNKDLFVHRIIIVNWGLLEKNVQFQREFIDKVWNKYFFSYVNDSNEQYQIQFIDSDSLSSSLGDGEKVTIFKDVALFSYSKEVRKHAKAGNVLPSPNDVNEGSEYNALEYSRRSDPDMLHLYYVKREAGMDIGAKRICYTREKVYKIYKELQGTAHVNIDKKVKNTLNIKYKEFT